MRYIRDDFIRVVATTGADSGNTARRFDAADRLIESIDANGNRASYGWVYDPTSLDSYAPGPHDRRPPMTDHAAELTRRESAARQAIKNGFDMDDEDSGVAMFVAFHLEELASDYWQARLGTARPDPSAVLELLVLREHWGGDDALQHLDFTLPDEVTDYVISVRFDAAGRIAEISMES